MKNALMGMRTAVVAFAAAALFALSGCGMGNAGTIGNDDASTSIALTNELGAPVCSVNVREQGKDSGGDPLPQSGYLNEGATAQLKVDAAVGTLYDVTLACINGATYELHGVPLADVQDAFAKVSPSTGLGYLTYTSVKLGDEINTLPDEKAFSEKSAYEASLVKVSFTSSHATVTVGKKSCKGSCSLKVVGGKKLTFTVKAQDGYEISKVTATSAGAKVKVKRTSSGAYRISADDVASGLTIKVTAKKVQTEQNTWNDNQYYTYNQGGSGTDDAGSGNDSGSGSGGKADSGPAKPSKPTQPTEPSDSGTGDNCFDL